MDKKAKMLEMLNELTARVNRGEIAALAIFGLHPVMGDEKATCFGGAVVEEEASMSDLEGSLNTLVGAMFKGINPVTFGAEDGFAKSH